MKTGDRGVFGQVDDFVFGKPAAQAVAALARRAGAERIFPMAGARRTGKPRRS
jgi:hypothetical protein